MNTNPIIQLIDRWRKIGHEHGVHQFTGNDHLLFANELETALYKLNLKELVYELEGVIHDVEENGVFDHVSINTIKRVQGLLNEIQR